MDKFIALVFAFLLVLTPQVIAAPLDNSAILAEYMKGVVRINTLMKDESDRVKMNLGTGFFTAENIITTAAHVVDKPGVSVKVMGSDGLGWYDAEIIAKDDTSDVALLRLKDWASYKANHEWKILTLSDNAALLPGDNVWAIGHPWGLDWTVSKGIVSSVFRYVETENDKIFVQVDARIYQGNSGGPVLNGYGFVIGMSDAVLALGGGSYGFATDSRTLAKITNELLETGEAFHERIGCVIKLDFEDGFYKVESVVEGQPCSILGIREGDRVSRIETAATGPGGVVIPDLNKLINWISLIREGERYTLTVLRDGVALSLDITAVREPVEPIR